MTDKLKCPIKDIAGYCGLYQISADGRVYRFYKNGNKRELGGNVSHGYMRVRLSMDNKARWHAVHRLVADAFIANPKKMPQINHKNGIKLDNRVENLEWCTASKNVQHAFKSGLNKNTKEQYELAKAATAKPVVCLETGEEYPSLTDAGKAKGVSFSHIGQCALGKRQTAGGYHWAYSDGKKAQDALKIAMETIDILYDAIRHNNIKETYHIADYVLKFASEQKQILKEITSITKQGESNG